MKDVLAAKPPELEWPPFFFVTEKSLETPKPWTRTTDTNYVHCCTRIFPPGTDKAP